MMTFPEYTKSCPEGVFQKTIAVTATEIGSSGYMQLGDLARQMERITEEHLSLFAMNREQLQEDGKIWVIAWTAIHILRLPKQGEQVILRVWPCPGKNMMYPRKYAFYSLAGEPLACASSLFLLMDSETRGIAQPTDKLRNIPGITLPREPELPKLRMKFPEKMLKRMIRTVQPEEIDQNGHLNNTHYLDWAEELLADSGIPADMPRFIWVQYSKELTVDQRVILQYEVENDTLFIQGYTEKIESFSLIMEF